MKKIRLVFIGATPFGEIVEIARDINKIKPTYEIYGILDDNAAFHGTTVEGTPVLGPLSMAKEMPQDIQFVFCIAYYKNRMQRANIIKKIGLPKQRYETLIHPMAKIYSTSTVGAGCIINSGVVVFNQTVIEDFVVMMVNSTVGPRNLVSTGTVIASLVSITKDVTIGPYVYIGTCAIIGENVKVGAGAQVAMASTVMKDVEPGSLVMGTPARFVRKDNVSEETIREWRNPIL